jgi:chromosome segregation ATPase
MRLPGPSDSRWALAWLVGLLIVLLLLMAGPNLHGQTGNESEPPSLTSLLEACERNLQTLNSRLVERQAQVQTLRDSLLRAESKLIDSRASLTDLQEKLAEAESSLATLQKDLSETQNSYNALSTSYSALEKSWQAYRSEMTKQVSDVTRDYQRARRWAIGFGVTSVIAVIVSVVLAIR